MTDALAPVAATACATVSKIGMPSKSVPPRPGVTPETIWEPYSRQRRGGSWPGAAGDVLCGAGDALGEDTRVLRDQDAHRPLPVAATAFCAPSSMSVAVLMSSPDSARICVPCSPFL